MWVIEPLQSRLTLIPAYVWVLLTAATVGAISASVAVLALGRVTNQTDELVVKSEMEN